MSETPSPEEPALFEDKEWEVVPLSLLERHDKLALTVMNRGVYPHSTPELNHAAALLEDRYSIGGSAKYLSIISRRVAKTTPRDDLPRDAKALPTSERVIVEIVGEFIDYHQDALRQLQALTEFGERLTRCEPRRIFEGEGALWDEEPAIRQATGELLRHEDAQLFLSGAGDDYMESNYDDPDALLRHREAFLLKGKSRVDIQMAIRAAKVWESNRARFWSDQIFGTEGEQGKPYRRGAVAIDVPALQQYIKRRLSGQ